MRQITMTNQILQNWVVILKVSFMTYLVHMDFNYWFFLSQVWIALSI